MKKQNRAFGFTLMESVIAIGVVAVLLTTFLAVFGPATQGIRRAISIQEADRLVSALEREMQVLRADDPDTYNTAFDKAFDWIANAGDDTKAIFLYNYKGDPSSITDGVMDAYDGDGGEPGKEYVLQASVRRKGDQRMDDELEAVSGPIYYVNMRQLVFSNDGLVVSDQAGSIVDPHSTGSKAADPDQYPEAVIAFAAEFYALKSSSKNYIDNLDLKDNDGDGNPDSLGRPLFSRNLAVRR